jgi:tRNA-dihydrouridine synthase 2
MRSTEKAQWERLAGIVDLVKSITDIPVIVNGDVFQYSDIEVAKKATRKITYLVFSILKNKELNIVYV